MLFKTTFSDACPALIMASRLTLPSSVHQLCYFHLLININRNLYSVLGKEKFDKFKKEFVITQQQETRELFELSWTQLLQRYPDADLNLTGNGSRMRQNGQNLAQRWF